MDYPYGLLPLKWNKKNNKVFTYGLSNRSLVSAKFQTLHYANVTDLGSGISYNYYYTLLFPLLLLYMKDLEASKFVILQCFQVTPFLR